MSSEKKLYCDDCVRNHDICLKCRKKIPQTTASTWQQVLDTGMIHYKSCLKNFDRILFNELNAPDVGDLVYETSHPDKKSGMGFLIAVDYNSGDPKYWIINVFNKKVTSWGNCKFVKIKGHCLNDYEEFKVIEKLNNKD